MPCAEPVVIRRRQQTQVLNRRGSTHMRSIYVFTHGQQGCLLTKGGYLCTGVTVCLSISNSVDRKEDAISEIPFERSPPHQLAGRHSSFSCGFVIFLPVPSDPVVRR